MSNLKIPKDDLDFIRSLPDFDLVMLLSEIHHFGWVHPRQPGVGGRALLPMIREALKVRGETEGKQSVKH